VIALSGTKLSFDPGDRPLQVHPLRARRSTRWRQALLLAPVFLTLFLGAAAEFFLRDIRSADRGGIFPALKGAIVAALKDPFALFAERSPGGRGSGALHMTKSSDGPHERVLARVREREPVADSLPGGDTPVFSDNPATIASTPGALPSGPTNTQDGASPSPTFNNTLFDFPGLPITNGGSPGGAGTSPSNPDGTDAPPSGPGGTDTSPSSPSGADAPPDGPGNGDTPPGQPGGTLGGTPPPTIAVPEPATWGLMILGLLGVLVIWRRDERKRAA
jgi:hypothetical protein